ncbi:hypothetical protein TEA_006647 [Camellia sinensis var. sinensis]|uniref:Splicing factor U2af large subunit n=1 Tax=Camellia sinensis var. sinensis TaxID=542762 RepID=A0A4S4DQP9_CAMSN|nr:hypothetical protein TEA_006647 [Camellia sinensis var. sinensis]
MSSYDDDGDRYTSRGGDDSHGGSSPYRHKHKSHESIHERYRTKDKSRDRHPRDYEERNVRGSRGRHQNNYGRHTNRDYGRWRSENMLHRDYDQDRERHHRHRSRSRSVEKSRNRSRSRSPSKSCFIDGYFVANVSFFYSKRTSGFDMAPPGGVVSAQLLGVPQTMPGMLQNMLPFGTTQVNQLGALSLMPFQAMTQQATRHARRVYVGGLPPLANEQTIATFFSSVMAAIGGNSAGTGDAVVNVYINHEKKFAFVEMRTGVSVRVRRPTDYNPSLAAALGPSQPSPHLNLSAVRLTPGMIGGVEGPDRIFVGGLPYYFTESQIRELLESFGFYILLEGHSVIKNAVSVIHSLQDPAATDVACAALNGLKMGDKTLTVRRASISNELVNTEHDSILAQAQQHIAFQKMALQAGGVSLPGIGVGPIASTETPTKVLCLTEVINVDELMDDGEYEEIVEDMREEGGKFGVLTDVIIPRPAPNGEQVPGVGKVFLEYSDAAACANAKDALSGRKFGGNVVTAVYYAEDKYYNRDYSA